MVGVVLIKFKGWVCIQLKTGFLYGTGGVNTLKPAEE
jgi:hypothetical protein